jgi:hypothetical protein
MEGSILLLLLFLHCRRRKKTTSITRSRYNRQNKMKKQELGECDPVQYHRQHKVFRLFVFSLSDFAGSSFSVCLSVSVCVCADNQNADD